MDLPGTRTEYVTAEGVAVAVTILSQYDARTEIVAEFDSPTATLPGRQTYDESYNHAVFGPGLPPDGRSRGRSGPATSSA